MKQLPQIVSINPAPFLRAMLNPYVAVGIVLLILALLVRMALLSLADLSYVVPMTAGGYIISAALGKFCLQENISAKGWAGTLLVVLGATLVGLTPRTTTEQAQNDGQDAQLHKQSIS
jgi:drug/metabolite transporter (DMT)-like permease